MKREIELRRRLRTLDALGEAVGAMKSLSAHHFREARNAVEPARTYREGVEHILRRVGATLPAGQGARGLLVIGAELGLCGSYNTQMVQAAAEKRAELGEGPTFCVGHRAATLLARRNVTSMKTYEGPTSVQGLPGLLLSLAEDVLFTFADEDLSSFDILSSHFGGVGKASPTTIRLLPIQTSTALPHQPIRYVDGDHMVTTVVREFLYITIYDLLLDALASEHGARLAATEAAETWLDQRTERLRRHLMATRREASTQEMIEIAAGVRARRANNL